MKQLHLGPTMEDGAIPFAKIKDGKILNLAEVVAVSQAISLKRIADALSSHPHGQHVTDYMRG